MLFVACVTISLLTNFDFIPKIGKSICCSINKRLPLERTTEHSIYSVKGKMRDDTIGVRARKRSNELNGRKEMRMCE